MKEDIYYLFMSVTQNSDTILIRNELLMQKKVPASFQLQRGTLYLIGLSE